MYNCYQSVELIQLKGEQMNKEKIIKLEQMIFESKRNIPWKEVEDYLKQYIGHAYVNKESKKKIYITREFADEYSNSNYTKKLRGAYAKIKANIIQILPEIIQKSYAMRHQSNYKEKHKKDAYNGWYRYTALIEIPIFDTNREKINQNLYTCTILVKCGCDMKMKLYDIIDIKKHK